MTVNYKLRDEAAAINKESKVRFILYIERYDTATATDGTSFAWIAAAVDLRKGACLFVCLQTDTEASQGLEIKSCHEIKSLEH